MKRDFYRHATYAAITVILTYGITYVLQVRDKVDKKDFDKLGEEVRRTGNAVDGISIKLDMVFSQYELKPKGGQ